MRSVVVPLLVLALVAGHARADSHGDAMHVRERKVHLWFLAGGLATYAISEGLIKPHAVAAHCRWCTGNDFDDDIRERLVWDHPQTAANLSSIIGYAGAPLVMSGLLALASSGVPGRGGVFVDDIIPVAEAAVYSQLVIQVVKFTTARQRPFVRFQNPDVPASIDDNVSFFSGHSALAWAIGMGAGVVAHRRHYKLEPLIWATGAAFGASTAYLRIAADRHYFSDVAVGSAFGVAAALLVPRMTKSLPADVSLVPVHNGLALAGSF